MEENNQKYESNEAKRQRLLGIENNDKIHDESKEIKKGSFFPNFWYNHKWKVIITSFFLIVAIVFIVQYLQAKRYDLLIAYAGPQYITDAQYEKTTEGFIAIMPDYNGDGEKALNFISTPYRNEEQRREMEEDDPFAQAFTESACAESYNSIVNQINSGDIVIFLMDKALFESLDSRFVSINEFLGYEVDEEMLCGENGIYLSKTALYSAYKEMKLPSDTIICISQNILTEDYDIEIARDYLSIIIGEK